MSWIGRLNIVKVSVLPNLIYRSSAIQIKIPASYFVNINKMILKFTWRDKRLRVANSTLKENKVRGLILRDFKTYKATVIRTVWCWWKNRQIDRWNRIEIPETGPRTERIESPHKYSQLIFDKGGQALQWSKDRFFNKWYWNNWTSTCK